MLAARRRTLESTIVFWKLSAPDGTIYWGNNGLGVGGGMWLTSAARRTSWTRWKRFIQNLAAGKLDV